MPSDIKMGMDAGASRYLTKPFSFLELKNTVDELVPAPEF
jgi:DNA-binding response OmpR family regulator